MLFDSPQFDALLDRLTVREHLELFARIRGVLKADLDGTVITVMRRMDLTRFEVRCWGVLRVFVVVYVFLY